MKILINKCFGGFGLSEAAYQWLIKNKGWKCIEVSGDSLYHDDCQKLMEQGYSLWVDPNWKYLSLRGQASYLGDDRSLEFRSNPDVVECVETLKAEAFGMCAKLKVVECDLPFEQIEVHDYDGMETLQTIPTKFG